MKDALELLDHLKLAKTHVIGVSAGGYSAQQLAIHHPDRLKSLVLFCSTPGFKGEQGKRWLRDAAKRGMHHLYFGERIEHLAGEMRRCAYARRCVIEAAGFGARERDEFPDRRRGH